MRPPTRLREIAKEINNKYPSIKAQVVLGGLELRVRVDNKHQELINKIAELTEEYCTW